MAFDMGFDFRSTLGFVTDPLYGCFTDQSVYPTTFTNANGDSINAGWSAGTTSQVNGTNTNDPRIAGCCYLSSGTVDFKVDLSSGSAPGAGTYLVDVALGFTNAQMQAAQVKDNTTQIIDLTNGGSGYSTAGNHYIDATGTDISATATWTGTAVSKAFASTLAVITLRKDLTASGVVTMSHFRLTLASSQSVVPLAMHYQTQRMA